MSNAYFRKLQKNCQPTRIYHEWMSYSVLDFADTYLPSVHLIRGSGVYWYDGAALFEDLIKTPKATFMLTNSNRLITMIAYTYPSGVLAAEKKHKVEVAPYELCLFVEREENDTLKIEYKFGRYVLEFLEKSKGSYWAAVALQEQVIKTTVSDFKAHFQNPLYLSDELL